MNSTEPKLRIFVNSDVTMSRGKYAAQAVHAALMALGVHPGVPVIVLGGSRDDIASMATVVRDAGRTEVEPGTVTAGTDWGHDPNCEGCAQCDESLMNLDPMEKYLSRAVRPNGAAHES